VLVVKKVIVVVWVGGIRGNRIFLVGGVSGETLKEREIVGVSIEMINV